ncbi:MAG: sugar transferase [Terriglobia bacterium]
MKNLLFKAQANGRESLGPLREVPSPSTADFLGEDDFVRVLALERKRAERSRKVLLLMLLDAGSLLKTPMGRKALAGVMAAVTTTTRETDVRGWYKKGCVIGVLFTEIGDGEKKLIREAVLARLTGDLGERLEAAQVAGICISWSFFPENWPAGNGNSPASPELYPDLFGNRKLKADGRAVKRIIDVAGAGLALICVAPLWAMIALLVRFTSQGPVLYRQKRVGQRGRHFDCLKFRSMHVSNDSGIHREYVRKFISARNQSNPRERIAGAVYKLQKDPRVTAVGRILRKTSLDELPQFWNVLKGEMSLVGPRPAIPYELECYDIWHRRRVLEVKPGITGLWQVHGRSKTTFDDMVRLDLKYARTWSVWLDLKILLKTPKVVVSGEGAC